MAQDFTLTQTGAQVQALLDSILPPIQTTQPAGGMLPNKLYDYGTITGSMIFSLATPSDASVPNVYFWIFDTGSTVPTIVWPSNLPWLSGSAPELDVNKHYEIKVIKGYATALEFSNAI